MSRYKDKFGKEIDLMEWGKLLETKGYNKVGYDVLNDGKVVSTVWLGLNHGYNGTELYFETMVFKSQDSFDEELCKRYSSLEEAEFGHKNIVNELTRHLGG